MNEQDSYLASARPVKVGILMDLPAKYSAHAYKVYDLVREQYAASGRMERGIEFVKRETFGPPSGPIKNTVDGFHQLVDEGCLVIVGPNHSDSNIALSSHVDARKVPVVALGATARHLSEYTFSIPWSSIPHDAFICASWLKKQGCKRVCFTWDKADHSEENVEHFRVAAERAGLRIIGDERFPQVISPALNGIFERTMQEFKRLDPDGIVHFGTCETAALWACYTVERAWNIPRVMNDAFFAAYLPQYGARMEGWVGTTMWDDANEVTAELFADYRKRYPDEAPPPHEMMSLYRDGMVTALEGVLLAPILTPEGIKRGLERIQLLPSACGGPRTCISFGRYDRRGLKGPDIMVLRRVKDGQVVMEGHIDMF